MARGATFAVIGAVGLGRDLAAVRDDVRQGLEQIVEARALGVQSRAQARAPRDKGDLIAAIQAKGRGLSWRVGIVDRTIPGRGGHNTAHLNPWVYGVWYELGFVTRQIPAQPYMRPAADEEDALFQRDVDALMSQAVR